MRVFEITAVGKLSILASRFASEDFPELNSPVIARRSGRSKRRSVRRNARIVGASADPGEITVSSLRLACFSSATILLVGSCSDARGSGRSPVLNASVVVGALRLLPGTLLRTGPNTVRPYLCFARAHCRAVSPLRRNVGEVEPLSMSCRPGPKNTCHLAGRSSPPDINVCRWLLAAARYGIRSVRSRSIGAPSFSDRGGDVAFCLPEPVRCRQSSIHGSSTQIESTSRTGVAAGVGAQPSIGAHQA